MTISRQSLGFILSVIPALLWSTSGVLGKVLLTGFLTPSRLVFYRALLGSFLLFLILLIWNKPLLRLNSRDLPYFLCMSILGLAFTQFTYYSAIQSLDVGFAILLQYLAPLWILLFERYYYKLPLSSSKITALGLALVGCLMISAETPRVEGLRGAGFVLGIAAGICFAAYGLMTQHALKSHHALKVLFYSLLFTAIFWGIFGPDSRASLREVSATKLWIIVYVAVFGTVIPYLIYLYALRLLEASRVGIISTLEPVFAAAIAWIYLGERLSLVQTAGGLCVLLDISILQLAQSK